MNELIKLTPRESGVFIAENSKLVTIDETALPKIVADLYQALERNELRKSSVAEDDLFPSPNLTQSEALNYVFFLDSVNYCFWTPKGNPEWKVEFNQKKNSGYFALSAAFARAYNKGINIFDPKTYSNITLDEVDEMFKGANGVSIPLVEKRLMCLKEAGNVLQEKYQGSFENCILKANKSAKELLRIIVEDFPCFDDSCEYLGKRVSFHKRAQILVGDVWGLYYGKGISEFVDIDTITMFADYRVPQVLALYGVLTYSDELLAVLKKNDILEGGSQIEVEIRGCSIRAVDLIVDALRLYMNDGSRRYFDSCNDITVDNYLWTYRRQNNDRLKHIPFHKVISTFY